MADREIQPDFMHACCRTHKTATLFLCEASTAAVVPLQRYARYPASAAGYVAYILVFLPMELWFFRRIAAIISVLISDSGITASDILNWLSQYFLSSEFILFLSSGVGS